MTDDATTSVLRRKVAAGPAPGPAAAGSALTLLRRSVARAAEDMQGLAASVTGLTDRRASTAELAEDADDLALLMTLTGPKDRRGLVVVDLQMLAGIVEHLTTGRVVPAEAARRNPTRTDAVMMAAFIDRVLVLFDVALASLADDRGLSGFRAGAYLAEARMIPLVLCDQSWSVLNITIDLGRGAKVGTLRLCFPDQQVDYPVGGETPGDWPERLGAAVSQSEVRVEGILHRMTLPLSDLANWMPGLVLPIPISALSAIEVRGLDGKTFALARLGQISGNRALRLVDVEMAPELTGQPTVSLDG